MEKARLLLLGWILTVDQGYYATGCLEGWIRDGRTHSCYKLFTHRLMWSWAVHYCGSQGAFISDITDYTNQIFIIDSVLGSQYIAHGVWIGGKDEGTGTWRWANSDPMNIDRYHWRKGNPDNGRVLIESRIAGENCMEMTTEIGYRGQLNDYYCDHEQSFLCKMNEVDIPTVNTTTITTLLVDTTYDVTVTSPPQNATGDMFQTSSTTVGQTTSRQHPSSPNIPVILITVSACVVLMLVVAIIVTISIRRRRRRQVPDLPIHIYEQTTSGQHQNEHIYIGLDDQTNHDTAAIHVNEEPSNAFDRMDDVGLSPDERTGPIQSSRSSNGHTLSGHGAQKGEYLSSNGNNCEEPLLENIHEHVYDELPNGYIDLHNVKGNQNGRKEDTRVKSSGYLDMDTGHYQVPVYNKSTNDNGLIIKGKEKGNNNGRKQDTRVLSRGYVDMDEGLNQVPAYTECPNDDGVNVNGNDKGNNSGQ